MGYKLAWLVTGALIAVGVVACGQAAPPLPGGAATVRHPDTTPGRARAATPVVEPGGTPTPLWTVLSISPTRVIQGATMALSPTVSTPSNPAWQDLVMQAKEDLAQRLSVDVDQIDLIEARAVVWPDSSMGCPQPGMAYTQVPRDGLLIRLRVGKRAYNYHSGGSRSPFLCEQATRDDIQGVSPAGDQGDR